MRTSKSAKKTKMADEGKVCVENKRAVLRIHDKLRKEVSQITENTPWTSDQKEEFEKKLLELYKDSVEETFKANVAIGGQDWDIESQSEASNDGQEEMEPVNHERLVQVFEIGSKLEDLIRDTTSKRKTYPNYITEGIRKVHQCQKEILDKYQPLLKSDSSLSSTSIVNPDFDECIQRLQTTSSDVARLSKSFPELYSKADRLQLAVKSLKAMQECETDAVLFAKENKESEQSQSCGPPISHDDQTSETSTPVEFSWWGLPKRRSYPPQRFDATKNTYCW